jgi:hypothetical protein
MPTGGIPKVRADAGNQPNFGFGAPALTSDQTGTNGFDGLLLERLYNWTEDYCIFMQKFGDRRSLMRGLRILSRMRRQLVEIALLERTISTLH